ncbi:MAG: hypothetical protein AAGA66_06840 [Bacteroidota bacterium]
MPITPYIRFVIGGGYFLGFLISLLKETDLESTHLFPWVSEIFAGLVASTYFAYCIRQGRKELNGENIELPYPRILAMLIETFNVILAISIIIQMERFPLLSVLPNLVITLGMAFLLIQNLRISFS